MKPYKVSEPLLFIHTPKAGGTTARTVVRSWFPDNFHEHYFDEVKGTLPEKISPFGLHTENNPLVIYGHFNKRRGFGIEDYYPEVNQFVTILRDPFELTVSSYYYTRAKSEKWKEKPASLNVGLEDYILSTEVNMLNHFPREVHLDNFREIIQDYFIYIGITEDLSQSLRNIGHLLNRKPPRRVGIENRTPRTSEVDPELRKLFREKHLLEYEVYEYVKSLHESAGQLGRSSLFAGLKRLLSPKRTGERLD